MNDFELPELDKLDLSLFNVLNTSGTEEDVTPWG